MERYYQEKFWQKVAKAGEDDCWIWSGTITPKGYGRFFYNGSLLRTHRLAYELTKGEIPKGLVVCHSCDVRACCNPNHLWVGTVADNNADARNKGRVFMDFHKKGENHPLSKLSDAEREEIKALREAGKSYRELGRLFGVSHVTIHEICKGKSYIYRN
jgi:hypothetical protein